MSRNDTSGSFAIGFIIGALIGLAVSTFYAPYSGKELRMKMADMFTDIAARTDKFRHPEKYSRIKP